MSTQKLSYLSTKALDKLYLNIETNKDRYLNGDFADLSEYGDLSIPLNVQVDLDLLTKLDPSGTPEAEVENTLLVWRGLHNLTPALACEDRIWTRLSHFECLKYSRERWLKAKDEGGILKNIRTHFFADGITGCRDDHSISRLWWNAKIAKNSRPNDQRGALNLMLKTADIRSNFIERSWTVSRPSVAASILRLMDHKAWITNSERNYREFMKTVNRKGGGIVFEFMSDTQIDKFMYDCYLQVAKS